MCREDVCRWHILFRCRPPILRKRYFWVLEVSGPGKCLDLKAGKRSLLVFLHGIAKKQLSSRIRSRIAACFVVHTTDCPVHRHLVQTAGFPVFHETTANTNLAHLASAIPGRSAIPRAPASQSQAAERLLTHKPKALARQSRRATAVVVAWAGRASEEGEVVNGGKIGPFPSVW